MARRGRGWLWAYGTLAILGAIAGGVMLWRFHEVALVSPLLWRNPWSFALLAGCLLLVWVGFHLHPARAASFYYSNVAALVRTKRGWVSRFSRLPVVLRIIAIGLLAVALARPQTFKTEDLEVEGIDIMIVLDLSKSMEERDLRRNRLDAGQRTIRHFLENRINDRIGLVVFARDAMLQSPLTLDYHSLEQVVADLAIGDVPEMGTAIGDALGLALASLRRSDSKSKVVVLVSDGDSNISNEMGPVEAKEIAVAMGVRVFTILMGQEAADEPVPGRNQYAVNPALLKEIARDTNGLYFNAGDSEALEASFQEVRRTLEKSRQRIVGRVADSELFLWAAVPAFLLLLLEIALSLTRWRRFP